MVWYSATTVQQVVTCNWAKLATSYPQHVWCGQGQSQLKSQLGAHLGTVGPSEGHCCPAFPLLLAVSSKARPAFADCSSGAIGSVQGAAASGKGWCLVTSPAASFCELQFRRPAWFSYEPMQAV